MNKNYHICEICDKSLNSEKQLIQHKKGKYHLSKLKNIKKNTENEIEKKEIKIDKQPSSYSIVNHPINGMLCKIFCSEHINIPSGKYSDFKLKNCYNGCTEKFITLQCNIHKESLDNCNKCNIGYINKYIIKCNIKTCKYIDKVDYVPVCCKNCGVIFDNKLDLSQSCIEENLFKNCPGCENRVCIGDFIFDNTTTAVAEICTNCGLPSCSECYVQCDLCYKNNFCMSCDFDHLLDFKNECKDSLDMCICNICHNDNSKCKHPYKVIVGLNVENNINHNSIVSAIDLIMKKNKHNFLPICFLLIHSNNNNNNNNNNNIILHDTKELKIIIQSNFNTFVLQAPSVYSNIQKNSWLAINSSILLSFNTTFNNFNNVTTIFNKLKKKINNHCFEKSFYNQ